MEIGDKLEFPDGDIATITKVEFFSDEEDSAGIYDAKRVTFTIDGDEDQQEFDEMLDSRDEYKWHIMKPLTF